MLQFSTLFHSHESRIAFVSLTPHPWLAGVYVFLRRKPDCRGSNSYQWKKYKIKYTTYTRTSSSNTIISHRPNDFLASGENMREKKGRSFFKPTSEIHTNIYSIDKDFWE